MKTLVATGIAISILTTNFLNEPQVNPAHQSVGGRVWVHGEGTSLTTATNVTRVVSEVFCTNAIVLKWVSIAEKCYEVQWTCNFVNWTNSGAWRVGTDGEIRFLTPVNLPQCFYRIRVVDCNALASRSTLPPPPPMPKMRGRL